MAKRTNATSPQRIAQRERQVEALGLRGRGFTFDQIAQTLGFESRSGAYRAVRSALDEMPVEAVDELRTLEALRLDYLLVKVWPGVEAGSLQSIDRALRILHAQAKLFGLYSLPSLEAKVEITLTEPSPRQPTSLDSVDPFLRENLYAALRALSDALGEKPHA